MCKHGEVINHDQSKFRRNNFQINIHMQADYSTYFLQQNFGKKKLIKISSINTTLYSFVFNFDLSY